MPKNKETKEELDLIGMLFNSMPFSYIFWKNTEGIYMGASTQQLKIFDKEHKGFIGKTIFEVLDDYDSAKAIDDIDNKIMSDGIPQIVEEPVVTPHGEKRIFLSQKQPIRDNNNNIIGLLGFSIDITDRKKLEDDLKKAKEQAERASVAKSKFIANMSHDIRTPLTGIVGLSDMLLDTVIKQESKEYAKMLNLSGEQLLSLLNSVLEVVSNESINQDEVNNVSFSISHLLQNLFELELPALKLKNLTLELVMDENTPETIQTDKGKLYRILLNLISNSIKFTESGSITIYVHHKDLRELGFTLCIDVLDTGIGIPKTETDKIFNPFYRVHPSYEGKYQGFGVGLHLVKRYVDALNGDINVKSVEGMGTKFFLSLPVAVAKQTQDDPNFDTKHTLEKTIEEINQPNEIKLAPEKEPSQTNTADKLQASTHVLLVEDNPMAMKVADMIITKLGATTDKAFNSHDALSLFKENRYDFVLTDIGLPDYSGFELAKKMRAFENESGLVETPIIGLTAHAKQEALLQGSQCGMIEVCEKPLTAKTASAYLEMFGNQKDKAPEADNDSPALTNDSQELPLLDIEPGIAQLGSIDELTEMLAIMLNQSLVVTVTDIHNQFEQQQWPKFKSVVHKFKSSCLYCATTKLLSLTTALEKLADTNDKTQIEPVYQQFQDCCEATRQYIESWLSRTI